MSRRIWFFVFRIFTLSVTASLSWTLFFIPEWVYNQLHFISTQKCNHYLLSLYFPLCYRQKLFGCRRTRGTTHLKKHVIEVWAILKCNIFSTLHRIYGYSTSLCKTLMSKNVPFLPFIWYLRHRNHMQHTSHNGLGGNKTVSINMKLFSQNQDLVLLPNWR